MTTVVSVHSFRGGTGKSNTTSNVAANLVALGHRVGVIDCDIQSPGIHVLFGFDETLDRTLNDYLWGTRPIRDVAHDITDRVSMSTGVAPGGSLHLVPSSMKPGDIARILRDGYDVESLSDGMRQLARDLDLDFLFVDTHPGLNEETLLSITLSDVLLLILRPDRQ
ncbi:MAG: MinD/ParA family protein, partial [Candidatus Nanopelagicales bacterium]